MTTKNTYISDSLAALDDFIKNASQELKDKIWLEVKEMDFEGPTIAEYFSQVLYGTSFQFEFQDVFEMGRIGGSPPFQSLTIDNETSKFYSESFFL